MFRIGKSKFFIQALIGFLAVASTFFYTPSKVSSADYKYNPAYFTATACVEDDSEKARLVLKWAKPNNFADLPDADFGPTRWKWVLKFKASSTRHNSDIEKSFNINATGTWITKEVWWGDHVTTQLSLVSTPAEEKESIVGQGSLDFTMPNEAPSIKGTAGAGDDPPLNLRAIPRFHYDTSHVDVFFKWNFKNNSTDAHDVKATRPGGVVFDNDATSWAIDQDPVKGKYEFTTLGVSGTSTVEVNSFDIAGAKWTYTAPPSQGGSEDKYNPKYFNANASTYNQEGKSKVYFSWRPPDNIDEFSVGGKTVAEDPTIKDFLRYVLNLYSPDSATPGNTRVGGSGDNWVHFFNETTVDVNDEVRWGKTYEAILDLRYQDTTIGQATLKFTMPAGPAVAKADHCEGDYHIENLEAMVERWGNDPNARYLHFRWTYPSGAPWKENIRGQRPDGSIFDKDKGMTKGATDKSPTTGKYKFTTLDNEDVEHGWCTVNVTSLDTPGWGDAAPGSKPGEGATSSNNTCGVLVQCKWADVFCEAISGALCALIQLIGNFTAWVMEHLYGSIFNAYLHGKDIASLILNGKI